MFNKYRTLLLSIFVISMIMHFQIKMARYGIMAIGMSTIEQLETKVLHATTYCTAVSTSIRIAKKHNWDEKKQTNSTTVTFQQPHKEMSRNSCFKGSYWIWAC